LATSNLLLTSCS